ncbi:hypothetical protein [Caulobacter segnis]|uniref:Uncharacterized protein n=1 Tax=Caulobacter segnis TaxID=88688 RepID=A0A2W5WHM1_9CAUL|nr:hypothetical protein [Caulobacter segnis]PZR33228.1 MAG: hypothetical protein DI526_14120 [Caulobacter segnis]
MAEMDPRTGKLDRLTIRCACGYSVNWTKQAILAKAGPWRRPAELARALRCSVCGAKGKARMDPS